MSDFVLSDPMCMWNCKHAVLVWPNELTCGHPILNENQEIAEQVQELVEEGKVCPYWEEEKPH